MKPSLFVMALQEVKGMNDNRKEGLDVVDRPAPNGWMIPIVKN